MRLQTLRVAGNVLGEVGFYLGLPRTADVARGAKPLEVDGLAKPTTARVMSLAQGGQTLLTADARQALDAAAAGDRATPSLQSHGHWQLKGVATPLELFEAGPDPAAFAAPPDGDKGFRVVQVDGRWLPLREVPNNLPNQASSFVGRERELDELKALLAEHRLVTLLGMGGLGKTRLSLQVAAELRAEFPDGTWFIDLSPLRDAALLASETAQVLGLREEPGRSLLQTLTHHLASRRALLVLDNCEHLIQAAATLAHGLVRAAPGLRLMASSREPLHVPGEQVYPVHPLPLPARGGGLAQVQGSAAARLFVARAQSHRGDWQLTEAEAPAVAELVQRLEGIPLALELAAARVRTLSVADINKRLHDRYKLLTGGSRVLQQRQQTLRALVDWSYDMLSEAEQGLFQRLGVFTGGFDLAAAEQVCADDTIDSADILDLLGSLVDKSLVLGSTPAGDTLYRMLETLREYAHGKLVAVGDGMAARIAAAHAQHYFALASGGPVRKRRKLCNAVVPGYTGRRQPAAGVAPPTSGIHPRKAGEGRPAFEPSVHQGALAPVFKPGRTSACLDRHRTMPPRYPRPSRAWRRPPGPVRPTAGSGCRWGARPWPPGAIRSCI